MSKLVTLMEELNEWKSWSDIPWNCGAGSGHRVMCEGKDEGTSVFTTMNFT